MLKTKEEIKEWLDSYGIEKYTINDDLKVDVDGNVWFPHKILKEILVQFNIVNGNFSCSMSNITSLKGCPKIVKQDFFCHTNKLLKSLEYCPILVYGEFDCDKMYKESNEYKKYLILKQLRK